MPDPISFFQECEALLKENGRLSLIIPEKNYCFDYFNAPSSTGQLLDAFHEKRSIPSPGQVFDHFANACMRDGQIAWGQAKLTKGKFELIHTLEQARDLWGNAQESEEYIDTHCWRFTPASFALFLSDVRMLGLTKLDVVKQFNTSGCEFYVTLGKNENSTKAKDRLSSLKSL